MGKECKLSICKLLLGGLPRNSVVWITDSPNVISAVYRGCKATNQINKQTKTFLNFQVRVQGFDYVGVGNSTNKKDAQSNCARDFVQYLVRLGHVKQSEVPSAMVSHMRIWLSKELIY